MEFFVLRQGTDQDKDNLKDQKSFLGFIITSLEIGKNRFKNV